jgi:hypothetical protein
MNKTFQGFLGGLALAAILALGTTCAHAQATAVAAQVATIAANLATPAKQKGAPIAGLTDPQLVARWSVLNDQCRGALDPSRSPACPQRQAVQATLTAHGWSETGTGVWYPSIAVSATLGIAQALENIQPQFREPVPLMVASHRQLAISGIDDVTFIAIWNDHSAQIALDYPFGWAILSELAKGISAAHPGDQRFALGQ